jgi:UDP-N-acetyl-D-glucosamine dehydrogenase
LKSEQSNLSTEQVFILGCGYVGLPIAVEAAKAGYSVTGYDTNFDKISNLRLGKTDSPEVSNLDLVELQKTGFLKFASSLEKPKQPSIYVIAVPTPLNAERKPDLAMLNAACKMISTTIVEGSLVVNESTSYIGTLTDLIKPTIIAGSGIKDLDFAVAPERIDPTNLKWSLKTTPRIIGGINESSVKRAVNFYKKFCENLVTVSKPEVAEAAKLFENTFRQVNIALTNEITSIAQSYNLSTHEIINAANTKPYGFMAFYPGVGVGGHCIPIDPSYLTFSANRRNVETKLIDLANEINFYNPHRVARLIIKFLDGNIQGKKIQIAGISYKPNISDIRESPVLELINQLSILGGDISWHDPLVKKWNDQKSVSLHTQIDLGVICTPHDLIDFSAWQDNQVKVIDLSANNTNYGWNKFF